MPKNAAETHHSGSNLLQAKLGGLSFPEQCASFDWEELAVASTGQTDRKSSRKQICTLVSDYALAAGLGEISDLAVRNRLPGMSRAERGYDLDAKMPQMTLRKFDPETIQRATLAMRVAAVTLDLGNWASVWGNLGIAPVDQAAQIVLDNSAQVSVTVRELSGNDLELTGVLANSAQIYPCFVGALMLSRSVFP